MSASAGDLEGRATSTAGMVVAPARGAIPKPALDSLPRRVRGALALKDFEALDKSFQQIVEEYMEKLPPEQRLRGLSPEERLRGLPPEERLQGLTPAELERLKRLLH